jgi:hypothetical protein
MAQEQMKDPMEVTVASRQRQMAPTVHPGKVVIQAGSKTGVLRDHLNGPVLLQCRWGALQHPFFLWQDLMPSNNSEGMNRLFLKLN